MSDETGGWLALDVGGANLKAAHSDGTAASLPFALWQRPDALPERLAALGARFPTTARIALTMTAELCDCYPTKRAGVLSVLDAVTEAFPGRTLAVWGLTGRFTTPRRSEATPLAPPPRTGWRWRPGSPGNSPRPPAWSSMWARPRPT